MPFYVSPAVPSYTTPKILCSTFSKNATNQLGPTRERDQVLLPIIVQRRRRRKQPTAGTPEARLRLSQGCLFSRPARAHWGDGVEVQSNSFRTRLFRRWVGFRRVCLEELSFVVGLGSRSDRDTTTSSNQPATSTSAGASHRIVHDTR